MNLLYKNKYIDQLFDDVFNMNNIFYDKNFYNHKNLLKHDFGSYTHNKIAQRSRENEKELLLFWDMPGVKKEDLKIEIENNKLFISSKRYDIDTKTEYMLNIDEKKYDLSSLSAALLDGVLELKINKKNENNHERKIIEIR